MLTSIITNGEITIASFFICLGVALVLGIASALICKIKNQYSKSFIICLAVLPAVVQIVIMLVGGNIGAGIAVAGAFSLVRFRSTPGTAREIAMIFLSMAMGLAIGMGYVILAVVFFVIMALFIVILTFTKFGEPKKAARMLKITIPEDLDYDGIFDDLFTKYFDSVELEKIKTVNMGTMYELVYKVIAKETEVPKAFFDELRCRNGNLKIVCAKVATDNIL